MLDFEYADEDIVSLRKQMGHPVSSVAPVLNPSPDHHAHSVPLSSPASSVPNDSQRHIGRKRRASSSSLSEAADDDEEEDDDDEDEDRPLASRISANTTSRSVAGKRNGKSAPGKKAKKSQAARKSSAPLAGGEELALVNGKINGSHKARIKIEDRMDESQLSRLAAGVPMDAVGRSTANPPIRTEKPSVIELRKGVIQITPVENDMLPRSLVILTGLKTLFQKQLPKMPREYIARLVYDANSKALAIIKRGFKVVGGICYRPFPHRGFAEIVFFATNSADQEKGYGGMLMDHYKAHIRRTYPDMMHFLTYADNFAVGYFEKQGFSKEITLDRSVWAGYIKDYEGGTIMQCTMLRKLDYLDKPRIFSQQQEAIMTKIRQMSRSHVVHPGLPQFQPGAPADVVVDPKDVPGLKETGWSPTMTINFVCVAPKSADYQVMERVLKSLQNHSSAWPFTKPVRIEEVPDYFDVVKRPMDLSTMEHKLTTHQYRTLEAFAEDAQLVFDNCRLYNPEHTIYAKHADKLEKAFRELMPDW